MGHKPMETPESYDLFLRRKYLLLLALLAILAAAVLFALTTGSSGTVSYTHLTLPTN